MKLFDLSFDFGIEEDCDCSKQISRGRFQCLTLLVPDIVEAIIDERQAAGVTLATLMEPFPVAWREQADALLQTP